MDTCILTGDPLFCSRIQRDESGSLWLTPARYVDDCLINIAAFKVRGVDVGVDYHRQFGAFGAIGMSFLGSYTDKWIIAPGGLIEPLDCAGRFGCDCGVPTPRWRHKARIIWTSRRGISLSAAWRYTAAMKLTPMCLARFRRRSSRRASSIWPQLLEFPTIMRSGSASTTSSTGNHRSCPVVNLPAAEAATATPIRNGTIRSGASSSRA
jgi:hypothetical protein